MSVRQFELFRNYIGISQCIRCGKNITDEHHHFFCERCWKLDKLGKIAEDIDAEAALTINGGEKK